MNNRIEWHFKNDVVQSFSFTSEEVEFLTSEVSVQGHKLLKGAFDLEQDSQSL